VIIQRLIYDRSPTGRIESVLSNRAKESWAYGYDDLDRLLLADNLDDPALDQSFAYDGVGNMRSNPALGT
jgi:hypothetical protein